MNKFGANVGGGLVITGQAGIPGIFTIQLNARDVQMITQVSDQVTRPVSWFRLPWSPGFGNHSLTTAETPDDEKDKRTRMKKK